jgi:phosphohistidine phosphatase SixA
VRHAYTPNASADQDFERTVKQEEYSHVQNLPVSIKNCLEKVDYIYCSNAVRTKQTCAMLQPYFLSNPTVSYCDILYTKKEAYSEIIWDLLKQVPSSKQHVMIIGHNPGLTDFYNSLPVPSYEFIHFPTLGLAKIQFYEEADWQTINAAAAVERSISA